MSFKLSLPLRKEMMMMRCATRTPKHFLIHMQWVICAIKQIDLDTNFQDDTEAVKTAMMDLDLGKMA